MNGLVKVYFNLRVEEQPSTGSDCYVPSEVTSIFTRDSVKSFMRKGDWKRLPTHRARSVHCLPYSLTLRAELLLSLQCRKVYGCPQNVTNMRVLIMSQKLLSLEFTVVQNSVCKGKRFLTKYSLPRTARNTFVLIIQISHPY